MTHVEMIIDYITDGTDFQYSDNHGVLTRCRDCRYKYGSDCDNFAGVWVKDDDFCSRAERREVSE